MELKIYNQNGTFKLTVNTADSSTWNLELMAENAVSANFTHPFFVTLEVNDYVMLEEVKFSMNKEYKPKQVSTQEYSYSVKFYGPEHDAARVMYLNLTDGQYSSEFVLDGSPRQHLQRWVENMNRIYGKTVWSIGDVVVVPNQTIEYNNSTCWDALSAMADAFETEWWADGYVINLCRCERGERVSLGYRQGMTSLNQSENSNDVKFFTRLIPLGSTRNIDRKRYGFSRLQLPDRATYVDRNTQYGLYEAVEADAFADIYPHYKGTVSSVRTEEQIGNDEKPFTVYYFKDAGMDFDPCQYEIAEQVKHITFQTGDLAGRDFEANYNSTTKEWEIINTYPNEQQQVPGGNLIPGKGNEYIPWNFSMPVEYEHAAEQEYKAAVDDYLAKYSEDIAKYGGETDYIYIERHNVPLQLGQSVHLLSTEYFGEEGGRDSRMTKVVRKLDNLSAATIECANQVGKGWKKSVDSTLEQLRYVVAQQQEESVLDILKSWDGREITDYRVLSGLRTLKEIELRTLSRLKSDEAAGLITFLKGLMIGDKGRGITIENNDSVTAVIDQIKRVLSIVSPGFVSGDLGAGFILKEDAETGESYFEVDRMLVRKLAYFVELVIKRLSHVGGEILLTPASMECTKVEELEAVYRCYFEQSEDNKAIIQEFEPDDLARAQTFNIKEGATQGAANSFYWRYVVGTGDNYIDLSKTDCATGSSIPAAGDHIVQLGNRNNPQRQNAIILSTVGDDAPSIKQYKGIDGYELGGKEVTIISPLLNKFIGNFISISTGKSVDEMLNEFQANLDIIREQTDKEYTIWFFDYDPAPDNIPASEWATDAQKVMHEQDMFYNRLTGHGYRFEKSGDTWVWNDITDHLTLMALENAAKAQDTADGKRRVFVEKPADGQAYDIGDLWTNAVYAEGGVKYDNDTLVCKVAKAAGEAFNIEHWQASSTVTTTYVKNMEGQFIAGVTESNEKIEALDKLAREGIEKATNMADDALKNLQGLSSDFTNMNNTLAEQTTVIEATKESVALLVQGKEKDEDGNIVNINTSGLVTTAYFNSLFSERVEFDENGHVANTATSGFITGADFSTQYSQMENEDGEIKRSEISTFITRNGDGTFTSDAFISADRIRFNGHIVANDTFEVDTDGNMTLNNITANNAKVSGKIEAYEGTIGGFSIESGRIGTEVVNGDEDHDIMVRGTGLFLYNDMIGFNGSGKRQVIVGAINSLGTNMLGIFRDTEETFLPKYGITLDISGSRTSNNAITGRGNAVLNGMMCGFSLEPISIDRPNTIYTGFSLKNGNTFFVTNTSGGDMVLPRLDDLLSSIGLSPQNTTTSFAVPLDIVCGYSTRTTYVYGRCNKSVTTNGVSGTPFNNGNYPQICNNNYGYEDYVAINKGDVLSLMLLRETGTEMYKAFIRYRSS